MRGSEGMGKSRAERVSVAEAVRKILNSHPSLLDALRLGVVNYSSLAGYIRGEVESQIKRGARMEAIKIALIRFARDLAEEWSVLENRVAAIISDSVLELKNDLAVVSARSERFLASLSKLAGVFHEARFIQITQGTEVFTLVVDLRLVDAVKTALGSENVVATLENQSAIILVSPPEIITTPGVVAYVTYLLASNGVNITQIISCHTDTIFVVDRRDALRAYSILEKQILLLRERK